MEAPPERLSCAALLAFDAEADSAVGAVELRRVDPIAPVSPDDVLALAARVRWPTPSPLAQALASAGNPPLSIGDPGHGEAQAVASAGDPPAATSDSDSPQGGRWHPIPHQGIDGEVAGFNLLLGTAEFIEDAGIPIPDAARQIIDRNAEQGWASVLVGACHRPSETQPARQSLIGILALGRRERGPDAKEAASLRARPPSDRPRVEDVFGTERQNDGVANAFDRVPARRRSRVLYLIGILAAASAVLGLALSCLFVAPDEVVVVQRLGRIVDRCGPGVHLRPLWIIETTTRVRPQAGRKLVVALTAVPPGVDREGVDWSPRDLSLTGDTWRVPAEHRPDAARSLSRTGEQNASQMVEAVVAVRYGISDVEAFLFGVAEPEAILAAEVEAVMRQLIGSRSLAVSMGPQRGELADLGCRLIQARLDAMGCGVQVHGLMLETLRLPPDTPFAALSKAEAEVALARSERPLALARAINERERLVAQTRIRAADLLAGAEVDCARRVAQAAGVADWVRARHRACAPAAEQAAVASQPAEAGGPTP